MTSLQQKRMALWGLAAVAAVIGLTAMAALEARSAPAGNGTTIGIRGDGTIAPAHERYRNYELGLYFFPESRSDDDDVRG